MAFILAALLYGFDISAQTASKVEKPDIEEVVVIGDTVGELGLFGKSDTGSRLGLTAKETPATVEIIDSEVMRARGYQRLTDAVESLPGVISGDHPAAPSSFSMRGFTRGQISILRDGLWVGPSSMVMRPQNTFNLERVEVLRGPSSVLNGLGAVGSVVNAVPKGAEVGAKQSYDALFSAGRFDSYQVGLGAGGSINPELGYRLDLSTYASNGFVDNTDSESSNVTGSLAWQIEEDLFLKLSADYVDDDVGTYFGTPLVPLSAARNPMTDIIATTTGETIDEDMRFNNYNVSDGQSRSNQLFLRADLEWNPSDNLTIQNSLYSFSADRKWINAEGYVYCTEVVDVCTNIGDIQRYYGYFFVFHDQEQFGNRLTLNQTGKLFGLENRFLVGAEFMDIDFKRSRGFRRAIPVSEGDSVDPYDPIPGVYGPLELRGVSPTDIQSLAMFAENALQVTDRLSFVTALRYDEMDLDRYNFNAEGVDEGSGFSRTYDWWSYRLGLVFDVSDDWTLYGQFSDANDPIGSNIFLVSSNQDFELTSSTQWEIGLKATLDKTEMTFAYFDITRDDIQQQFALDSTTNIGGQDSSGLEFSVTSQLSTKWKLGANAAYTDASFERGTNTIALAGNTPPNVPETTANLWTSYSNIAETPLEIGGGYRFIDDRFGDNNNDVRFKSYQLFDAYLAWVQDNYRVAFRVDNLTDEPYVAWSDVFYLGQTDPSFIYANQVMLGAPRQYSMTLQIKF
ncbi:MAG: iron complex outermembrane receptor protein [Lentisphaeria bacterium]|jgi:iron complex outermembrane receptor protein